MFVLIALNSPPILPVVFDSKSDFILSLEPLIKETLVELKSDFVSALFLAVIVARVSIVFLPSTSTFNVLVFLASEPTELTPITMETFVAVAIASATELRFDSTVSEDALWSLTFNNVFDSAVFCASKNVPVYMPAMDTATFFI